MIVCENIVLGYHGNTILENLSFRLERGEKACINGTSGKGKTSILKMLQGYVTPDAGRIIVADKELSSGTVHEIRRRIAWVPQNIDLPVRNGKELMTLLGIQEEEDRVGACLRKLGLPEGLTSHPFDEISGGQKQRVIISICLALDREIILMDEPTASLDDDSITKLIGLVESLEGKTILSASHNRQWHAHTQKLIEL